MNISIFGLGYVGAVTAGCLARQGHAITGVDAQALKVECFNQGVPPIVEPGLEELLRDAKAGGRLKATQHSGDAIAQTDLSIICVGTPSTVAGSLDLGFVRQVLKEIRTALRHRHKSHAVVIRSTMLPGSTARLVSESLAELEANGGLSIYYYPEFLREGTAIADFDHPSLAVVGTRDGSRPPDALMSGLFGVDAGVVNWQTAEMVKYACNAFHATKIAFANEIGRIASLVEVDSRAVMDLLCRDTRLNVSASYLRPGNPFGGSCLPKDVRALVHQGRTHGLSLPVIENLLPSNERHVQALLARILEAGQQEVVILGLAFKANTDDLRESPMVEVAQSLLGRGYQIRIFDPALNLSKLIGANKRVIDARMPHLATLLKSEPAGALGDRGLIVAAQRCVSLEDLKALVTPHHQILDVNSWPELMQLPARYQGFCW